MKYLLVLLTSLTIASGAQAQEFGILAGVHNVDVDTQVLETEAEIGFKVGLAVSIELTDTVRFRTGALYTTRHFEMEAPGVLRQKAKFSYLDIPALFQFNINETVGFYAGPVVAVNVGKKVESTNLISGATIEGDAADMNSIYLLGEVGANFTFDMIGFDVYYQRGFGEIAQSNGPEDYSIIGADVVYWF